MKPAGLKAAIIAGCVVLSVLVTASGAHAINISWWKCPGGRMVEAEVVKDERWRKTGEAGYSVTISGLDGEGLHGNRNDNLRVRFKHGDAYLNGRRCQACFYSDCSKEGLKAERQKERGQLPICVLTFDPANPGVVIAHEPERCTPPNSMLSK